MSTQVATRRQVVGAPLPQPERDTLTKLFFAAVDRYGRADAMRYKADGRWRELSHAELEARVTRLAAALDELGIARGERVALLAENRPEWAISDYAALALGVIDVPIYPTLPAPQIEYILRDCAARLVFVSTREQLDKILAVRGRLPALEHVVIYDDPQAEEPGVRRFAELLEAGRHAVEAGRAGDLRARALAVEPHDVATLIYTSGTTGDPKGVMLTHRNLAGNVAAAIAHGIIEVQPGQTALSFLPLSHVLERMVDYYFFERGACLAYAESIEKLPENLAEVAPDYIVAVPRVFEKIYAKVMGATGPKHYVVRWARKVGREVAERRLAGRGLPAGLALRQRVADRLVFAKLRQRTGGRLRAAISGGAPLPPEIARFFFAAGLPIYEGYGLTETSPVLTCNRMGALRPGTVGQVVPGTELRLEAESGEIVVRGPQVMQGYWNRPEASAAVLEPDGWLHTGDVGELDEDGFLRITDRIKNLIVTAGGKNIAPQPIENLAAMSPYIAQAVMIGDGRPFPVLLVVPDFENLRRWAKIHHLDTGSRERLIGEERVRGMLEHEALKRLSGLARYELPKKVALLPEEFTIEAGLLTPTLKVRRSAVARAHRARIEELYAGTAPELG